MRIKQLFIIYFLCIFSLFAQKSIDKKVYLVGFEPFKTKTESDNERKIKIKLEEKLQSLGYIVELGERGNLKSNLTDAKSKGSTLFVSGYYSRNASGNLSIYVQFYNPSTGLLVDAVNLSDELVEIEGVKLDEKEIREADDTLIDKFAVKVERRVKLNPNAKEVKENISELIENTKLGKEISFPIRKEEDSVNKEADDVFKFLENQEVTTATKTKISVREAPAAIYVINQAQIRERGYKFLTDALRDLPGFQFIHAYGVWPDLIFQRGLAGNNNQRTLIYVDGIPDNNLSENSTLAGTIRFPLHNVERIEVVSGPASSLYGANAVNGIINIITKDGKANPSNEATATYGTWDGKFKTPGYGGTITSRGSIGKEEETMYYSASAYYFNTEGPFFGNHKRLDKANVNPNDAAYYIESKACGGQCNPSGTSVGYWWSDRFNGANIDTYNITGKLNYKNFRFETVNHQYLQGTGVFQNGTRRLDYEDRAIQTKDNDTRSLVRKYGALAGYNSIQGASGNAWDFRNNSVYMGYLWNINTKLSLDSELIARSTNLLSSSRDSAFRNPGPFAYYRPENSAQNTFHRLDYGYELRERLQWEISPKLSATIGVDGAYTIIPRGYNSSKRVKFSNYAMYGQIVYRPWEILTLTFGYRYDLNTLYGAAYTPRVSAVVKATDNLTLKFLYGSAFRAPSGWELFSATGARKENLELKPERLQSFEVGIGYRLLKKYYFSVQAFSNTVKDIILEVKTEDRTPDLVTRLAPSGGTWNQNQNAGNAKIQGLEFISELPILKDLNINFNYSYTRGRFVDLSSFLIASPAVEGRVGDNYIIDIGNKILNRSFVPSEGRIPNYPEHSGNLGITYYITKTLSFYLGDNWVDVRRTVATNPVKTVKGYHFVRTNIRKQDFIFENLFIQLEINNLLNKQFFDPGYRTGDGLAVPTMLPLEGRNYWLTLGYQF